VAGSLVVFLVVALTTLAVLGQIGREISAQHEGILGPEWILTTPKHPLRSSAGAQGARVLQSPTQEVEPESRLPRWSPSRSPG
jgi:hypothetical protein